MPQKTLAQIIHDAGLSGQNYPAIADALNAPTTVANPDAGKVETITTPVDITLKAIMAIVPPAEMAKVYALSGFVDDVRRAIDSNDREYMGILIQIAVAANTISANSAQALGGLLASTTTTETVQPATVQGPSLAAAAGLPYVTPSMVQTADQLTGGAGLYAVAQ